MVEKRLGPRPSWRLDAGADILAQRRSCRIFCARPQVSIAEAYDTPVTRRPLVPPSPPRAPDTMTAFGRMAAMRVSPIGTWGQRAYEEHIVQGRCLARASFTL